MKRVLAILTILFLLLIPVTAFAATKTYEIPEMHMRIDIPDDMIVFFRDVDPNDPNLAFLGTDEKSFEQALESNNLYFTAMQFEPFEQIGVTMFESDESRNDFNFNLLSEEELETIFENIKSNELAYENRTYHSGFSIYKHAQATFIRMYEKHSNDTNVPYLLHYYTVINGKNISIMFSTINKEITQEQEELFKVVVDSVYFTQEKELQNPSVQASTTAEDKTNASTQTSLLNKISEKALGGILAGAAAGGAVAIWAAIKRKRKKDGQDTMRQ